MLDNYHIRWMIRRDMPEVLLADQESFGEKCWEEAAFLTALRQRNCIGMVIETTSRDADGKERWDRSQVVGYMIYYLFKGHLYLERFAVHPQFRHLGLGQRLIGKLAGKLSAHRRTKIVTTVPESLLQTLLFLRDFGFKAKLPLLFDVTIDSEEALIQLEYLTPDANEEHDIQEGLAA